MNTCKFFSINFGKARQRKRRRLYYQKPGRHENDNIENSDIYILNTCTVTKSADKKARNRLRFIKKNNPGIHLVATGCYPQRNESEVLSLGIVDTIISNDKKNQLPVILSEKFSKNIPLIVEP